MRIVFSYGAVAVGSPAIFIDRDGVINCKRPGDYVREWSQFLFVPGIREALRRLSNLNLPLIVISNQSAVGRGLLRAAVLEEITVRMHETLLSDGTRLAAVYYCTHNPDEYCPCRKPRPELLHRAAADFPISLARSIFVGDSHTDTQAALSAGCQPVLFGLGPGSSPDPLPVVTELPAALTAHDLFDVAVDSLRTASKRCVDRTSQT